MIRERSAPDCVSSRCAGRHPRDARHDPATPTEDDELGREPEDALEPEQRQRLNERTRRRRPRRAKAGARDRRCPTTSSSRTFGAIGTTKPAARSTKSSPSPAASLPRCAQTIAFASSQAVAGVSFVITLLYLLATHRRHREPRMCFRLTGETTTARRRTARAFGGARDEVRPPSPPCGWGRPKMPKHPGHLPDRGRAPSTPELILLGTTPNPIWQRKTLPMGRPATMGNIEGSSRLSLDMELGAESA